jgi:hypothetical protein
MEFTEQEYLLDVVGPDADAVFAAVERLSRAPEVEWACPNTAFRSRLPTPAMPVGHAPAGELRIAAAGQDANNPRVFPNDEYFPMQWHLHNTGQSGGTPGVDIRAPEAWEITTGDPNIVVAMIDCGVDVNHPDLMNNLVAGYDFYDNDSQVDPEGSAHGTACAGLVAAQGNNGIGVTGVTWDCKLMPIRIARALTFVSMADLATSFRWAAAHGADIFSDSYTYYSSPQPIVQSAIVDVTVEGGIGRNGRGCIFLTATANSSGPMEYPEKYPQVISVSPTDHNDLRCTYSSHGPELDIVAPSAPSDRGADRLATKGRGWIWTTDITGSPGFSSSYNPYPDVLDYTLFTGSSAACPIAAGVAALILSIEPSLTSDEVRHFLERSAKDLGDPGRDDYYGWGRVDARAALDMVLAKRADLNNDWKVDEVDQALLMKAMEAKDRSADIAPAAKRDGVVDAKDLELLTRYLGTVIPELGLIAHWKLDETAGTVAFDSAGEHRDATVMGTPLWRADGGKVGGALELSGVPNFATAKFARDPSQGPLSVFVWVKGGAPGQVILSQAGGANWLMAATGDGTLKTDLKSADRLAKSLTSTAVITDGDWHRVGLSWDGSNRILYVDGMEVARDTQASLTGSTGNMVIGAGSIMTPASFWKGLIDDIRLYDRAIKP